MLGSPKVVILTECNRNERTRGETWLFVIMLSPKLPSSLKRMVDLSVELSGVNLIFIIIINQNNSTFEGTDLNWARLNGEDSELCLKITEVFSVQ
jgi:hypothetical protein